MPRNDDGGNAGEVLAELPDDAPPWLISMYADIGTKEIKGKRHNPKVVRYFKDAGFTGVKDDETAWCAACVGAHLERSNVPSSKSLAARSYERWGKPLDKPRIGCVVPLWRGSPKGWQGHVGLYMGETRQHVLLLGGNQGDALTIAKFPKNRVLGYRWPRSPVEMRTSQAAAGSAGTGTTSLALNATGEALVKTAAPVVTPDVPDLQPLQDGLVQIGNYMQAAAILAGVISVCLALYVIYRRYRDHKERGL